ncbi:DUF5686 and carboxypeptidase regulatory-like domain-containing protein [Flavobacteriaceae bacterium F08102]|nr:DUF5686 and carboxypeptidase regulatory-like domain-containing protein [Flavobacteriaceae bacterium F08102]
MQRVSLLIFFLFPTMLLAQHSVSGIVKDKNTNDPLPFATLITDGGAGTITDTDGKFNFNSKLPIRFLNISYIGYKAQKVDLNNSQNFYTILLEPSSENLNEVIVLAKENPAIQIIKNTIANKKKNNIEKALASFKYTAYNKLLITANPDSIQGTVDSLFVVKDRGKTFLKLDSTNYEFKKEISKQHMYITEKVSEFKFDRGKNKKETVLATRMAGLKNPIYELLALNLENFTFYDEIYTLLGEKYVNPLARNALKIYNYKILDTINYPDHSAYMIYFKPKKEEDKLGLEGVLYIHNQSYALEKVIAEIKAAIHVKATQNFKFIPEYNIWFPDETQLSLRKGKNRKALSLFGIKLDVDEETTNRKDSTVIRNNEQDLSDLIYMLSKTKNFDISINEPVKVKNSAAVIEIDDKAAMRDQAFWNKYRTDSITKRGLNTYENLDSIVKADNIEQILEASRTVLKGFIPLGFVDFDLSQLITFNNYEGFRLGLGGMTNHKLSPHFRIGGYTAYGFRDDDFKYHLEAAFRLSKINNTWLGGGYTNDIFEAAKLNFLFEDTSFTLVNPRNLNISQFYGFETYYLNLDHDIFPNLEAKFRLERGAYRPLFDYQYFSHGNLLSNYHLTEATFAIQWTPFSTYMNSPIGKIPTKNGFPKITAQVTQSVDDWLDSDFNFTKFNFKIEHDINYLNSSSSSLLVQGGSIFGDTPLPQLYNAFPNYSLANPWRKRVNISGTNAFETMAFNEFISDKYISFQLRHNFPRFKISESFKPRLSLITRYAIGDIENPEKHIGVSFRKMNKGYIESGFVVNHLLYGFGISSFYRYGAYHNPKFSDNLAVKITYVLSLGF